MEPKYIYFEPFIIIIIINLVSNELIKMLGNWTLDLFF